MKAEYPLSKIAPVNGLLPHPRDLLPSRPDPQRMVWTQAEGTTRRPACGPTVAACLQMPTGMGAGPLGFQIYRCVRCGDEEWL